ncbi:hypothetical protein RhiJN_15202 [Ceratobasidium sp. AG-Ba]|nr:hypothetical protein RhiJN_15202 [Ceratobasidium sp. AG-Ba]
MNREQPGTHPHMLPLRNNWETARLDNSAPIPLSKAELIATVESARINQLQAQPPVPAYIPQGSTLIAKESAHSTLNGTQMHTTTPTHQNIKPAHPLHPYKHSSDSSQQHQRETH